MKLTPRAGEVKHIAAVIDQEYPSATAAAKAVIKATSEALDLRDWLVIVDGPLLWGPFATEKEAEKAMSVMQAQGLMADARLHDLRTGARMLARLDNVPLDEDCGCGHPAAEHLVNGNSRAKCGWSTCDCEQFKKASHPIPPHPICFSCKQIVPT